MASMTSLRLLGGSVPQHEEQPGDGVHLPLHGGAHGAVDEVDGLYRLVLPEFAYSRTPCCSLFEHHRMEECHCMICNDFHHDLQVLATHPLQAIGGMTSTPYVRAEKQLGRMLSGSPCTAAASASQDPVGFLFFCFLSGHREEPKALTHLDFASAARIRLPSCALRW
jgi:hypothetical protein